MEIAYFNGDFIPREEVKISPDDRGFLFAEGIYEVVRWYGSFFFDMEGHLERLKRSLREVRIEWQDAESFPQIALDLVRSNRFELNRIPALVYLQVTRGAARRTHAFPIPPVKPTVYAFARSFKPENEGRESGIAVMMHKDIRWGRCDIKSTALLPNTLCFQAAVEKGFAECAFVRDGNITECSHSNIFFGKGDTLYTHPESEYILSGITRKNIIRIARTIGIKVVEEAVRSDTVHMCSEAFITNTSGEVTPVTAFDKIMIGNGKPGPLTETIWKRFSDEILSLRP